MGTLIIIVFTIIVIVSSVRDVAKKAMKPILEEVEDSQDDNEMCEMAKEMASHEEPEDYIYYNTTFEEPVQNEPNPITNKRTEDAPIMNHKQEYENEDEFQFDLRQAIISQTILQNDYVDNLK